MSKMKHTPGPWLLDDDALPGGVYCDDKVGSIVARCAGDGFEFARRPEAEWRANAALIAAAPDLFAACEFLVHVEDTAGGWLADDIIETFLRMARPAIAKARGGEE